MTSVAKGMVLSRGLSRLVSRCSFHGSLSASSQQLHTSTVVKADHDDYTDISKTMWTKKPKKFLSYNDVVYPPTKEGEEIRPAEYCHMKKVAGSQKKFWYAAVLVRGLSIDEAIRQCDFSNKLCPKIIKEVLLEAQEHMIKECNVEFASNMWVADSYPTRGGKYQTVRRKFKFGANRVEHPITNYFVRLREGPPPEHYYPREPTGYEKLEEYIQQQRMRKIRNSL